NQYLLEKKHAQIISFRLLVTCQLNIEQANENKII
ncbi:MAG: hypothetical protein ACI9K1_001866, partial [Arcticibacterium sp.]